jgi:serine/threonine protein kinase
VIDVRPLRLREKFNPARLRREVDIMRRLQHPNIIQFVEVFETPESLMVVMEYAPGRELFDVRRSHDKTMTSLFTFLHR